MTPVSYLAPMPSLLGGVVPVCTILDPKVWGSTSCWACRVRYSTNKWDLRGTFGIWDLRGKIWDWRYKFVWIWDLRGEHFYV